MASYASVPKSDITQEGQQRQEQQPIADVSFNGERGVRRSEEWWWEAGPVDSCCCCCSLSTGMVLLAANDLLNGIWMTFFMEAVRVQQLRTMLGEARGVYELNCTGNAASRSDCAELKESMEQAEDDVNVLLHLPFIYYVQGVTYILAGILGVWAVGFKNTRCAKVYMLSWPAKFFLGLWTTLDLVLSMKKYGVEQQGHVFPVLLLNTLFLIYFFKVSWSYYHRLDYKNNRSSISSTRGGGSASSDMEGPALAMLNVNSSV